MGDTNRKVRIYASEPTARIHEFHNRSIRLDGYEFEYGGDMDDCDVFVVFAEGGWNGMRFKSNAPKRICITGEPSCIYRYSTEFFSQFTDVVTSQADVMVPSWTRVHRHCQGLNSFLGVDVTDGNRLVEERALATLDNRSKERLISAVCSDKCHTPYQKLRKDFLLRLKSDLPELDLYGSIGGGSMMAFKDEALANYRYTIAIENCRTDDYWTEKLSDPILSLTQPIYCGCPNIGRYFNDIWTIDIEDYEGSLEKITNIIRGDYSLQQMLDRRAKLESEYMLHHIIYKVAEGLI